MQLILGSASPRRKEILNFFSLPFEQATPLFSEKSVHFEGDVEKYVQILSKKKSDSLAPLFPKAVVLTADTCVYKDGKIFTKPTTEKEAFHMLSQLNGSWHTVYTAVTARKKREEATLCEKTKILFHHVSDRQLEKYHRAFNGIDKAGGYGIQNAGSIIVKRIEGCFYNVMGLPISATAQVLNKMGIDLWCYLASF